MAISLFERAIDEHIAKQQQADGLPITVDLSKPVINEAVRRAENLNRQLKLKVKTVNGAKALDDVIT